MRVYVKCILGAVLVGTALLLIGLGGQCARTGTGSPPGVEDVDRSSTKRDSSSSRASYEMAPSPKESAIPSTPRTLPISEALGVKVADTTRAGSHGPILDAATFPTSLPDSPAVKKVLEESGKADLRYIYDYTLGMYAYANRCIEPKILAGKLNYWLRWKYDDKGVGHTAGFDLDDRFPPEVSEEELKRFGACVQAYVSSHSVNTLGAESWAMLTRFPLENDPLVRFAATGEVHPPPDE